MKLSDWFRNWRGVQLHRKLTRSKMVWQRAQARTAYSLKTWGSIWGLKGNFGASIQLSKSDLDLKIRRTGLDRLSGLGEPFYFCGCHVINNWQMSFSGPEDTRPQMTWVNPLGRRRLGRSGLSGYERVCKLRGCAQILFKVLLIVNILAGWGL